MEKIHIPEDMVLNIICRLHFKSLIRFKAVSKTWQNYIENSNYLAQTHLLETTKTKTPPSCLLLTCESGIYFVHDQQLPLCATTKIPFPCFSATIPQTPSQGEDVHLRIKVVGSCNGLLLLQVATYEWLFARDRDYFIWNPCIPKVTKQLPVEFVKVNYSLKSYNCLGFGYDCFTGYYKVLFDVVQQVDAANDPVTQQVLIYRFRLTTTNDDDDDDDWTIINPCPSIDCRRITERESVVLFNNCMHWKVKMPSLQSPLILRFDLHQETWSIINPQTQTQTNHINIKNFNLTLFQGFLGIEQYVDGQLDATKGILSGVVELWVMKHQSWTRVFVSEPFLNYGLVSRSKAEDPHFRILTPALYYYSHKFWLVRKDKNIYGNRISRIDIKGCPFDHQITLHRFFVGTIIPVV